MPNENKRKFALWMKPKTLDSVREYYRKDNCKSQSEFIEKATQFYLGYLSCEDNSHYLPSIVTSTLRGIVSESESKITSTIFKMAVELSMAMHVVASLNGIENKDLEELRYDCMREVKTIGGTVRLKDARKFQKGV
jgi:hypothetical protein